MDDGVAELVARDLTDSDLASDGLRSVRVSRASSKVAAMPRVREELLTFQRRFADSPGGAVLDGRDIGTVICPDADVKLFVTASDKTRARRRFQELQAGGAETTLDQVSYDLKARDARDAGRADAPMKRADDAHLLDTTELDIDAAVAKAAEIIEQALERARS